MDFGLRWHQPDDPNSMGTLMVRVAAHAAPPGGSCQTVSLVRSTARASHAPVDPVRASRFLAAVRAAAARCPPGR